MDILVQFLMQVLASIVGILFAAWFVDHFQNWKSRRRK